MEKGDVRNKVISNLIGGGKLMTDKVQMFDTRHETISEISLTLTCQTDKCAQQFILIPDEEPNKENCGDDSETD